MPKYEDLSGKIFGRWSVLKKAKNHGRRTAWLCRCECGVEKEVLSCHLKSGRSQSCGCLRSEINSEKRIKNLLGNKYGKLTVIAQDPERTECNRVRWICRCECGQIKSIQGIHLEQGKIISCGCEHESNGVFLIKEYLNNNNIKYQQEFYFEDLYRYKNYPLRFDFAIFGPEDKLLFLIEFQGEQHFKQSQFMDKEGLLDLQFRDKMKITYCEQNNIPLYHIAYNEVQQIQYILKNILDKHK